MDNEVSEERTDKTVKTIQRKGPKVPYKVIKAYVKEKRGDRNLYLDYQGKEKDWYRPEISQEKIGLINPLKRCPWVDDGC